MKITSMIRERWSYTNLPQKQKAYTNIEINETLHNRFNLSIKYYEHYICCFISLEI